jgi:Helix-hairpin-helix domain
MTTPVSEVNGIGPKTVEFLKRRRISTVEALVKRGASVLETAPGFSPGRAANVLKVAAAVLNGTYVSKKTRAVSKPKSKPVNSDKKDKKDKKKAKDKKSKNKKSKKDKKNKKGKDKKKNKKDKKGKKNKK